MEVLGIKINSDLSSNNQCNTIITKFSDILGDIISPSNQNTGENELSRNTVISLLDFLEFQNINIHIAFQFYLLMTNPKNMLKPITIKDIIDSYKELVEK